MLCQLDLPNKPFRQFPKPHYSSVPSFQYSNWGEAPKFWDKGDDDRLSRRYDETARIYYNLSVSDPENAFDDGGRWLNEVNIPPLQA